MNAVLNRLALDAASIEIEHCRVDENGRFIEKINSGLSYCLNDEANIDQSGRSFLLDVYLSLLDEGCIAIVPIETTLNPKVGSFDVKNVRTAKIIQWYPQHVKVHVYNEKTGNYEDIVMPKRA